MSVKVPLFKGDLGGSESDRVVCRHALENSLNWTIDLPLDSRSALAGDLSTFYLERLEQSG
jgi:hypothetical protein